MKRTRIAIAATSVLSVPTAWVVGVAWSYDSAGELVDDMAVFLVVLTVIAAAPCVAYVLAVRGRALSLAIGGALLALDVALHALSAWVHATGNPGGAGGMLFWFCLPAVALTYPLVFFAAIADAAHRAQPHRIAPTWPPAPVPWPAPAPATRPPPPAPPAPVDNGEAPSTWPHPT